MKQNTYQLSVEEPQTGHIYIVDLKACTDVYGWLLSAVLLHQQPFIGQKSKIPQSTSVATLQIKSPMLHNQVLSIQQALIDGRRIYAEIAYSQLQLLAEAKDNAVPTTMAELLEFSHLVVEYRKGELSNT